MAKCSVELKCKYGIGDVCRFNILVDGQKYSKVFNCSEDLDIVKKNAEDACERGLLAIIWEAGWRDDCPKD